MIAILWAFQQKIKDLCNIRTVVHHFEPNHGLSHPTQGFSRSTGFTMFKRGIKLGSRPPKCTRKITNSFLLPPYSRTSRRNYTQTNKNQKKKTKNDRKKTTTKTRALGQ